MAGTNSTKFYNFFHGFHEFWGDSEFCRIRQGSREAAASGRIRPQPAVVWWPTSTARLSATSGNFAVCTSATTGAPRSATAVSSLPRRPGRLLLLLPLHLTEHVHTRRRLRVHPRPVRPRRPVAPRPTSAAAAAPASSDLRGAAVHLRRFFQARATRDCPQQVRPPAA
jgi:hypothetical protein